VDIPWLNLRVKVPHVSILVPSGQCVSWGVHGGYYCSLPGAGSAAMQNTRAGPQGACVNNIMTDSVRCCWGPEAVPMFGMLHERAPAAYLGGVQFQSLEDHRACAVSN
jgi:hypothetical protein